MKKRKINKKKQLALLDGWLSKFPCNNYFGLFICIREFITPKDLYKFIAEKRNKYEKENNNK